MPWCCCLALLHLLHDKLRKMCVCAFRQEGWNGLPGIEAEMNDQDELAMCSHLCEQRLMAGKAPTALQARPA